MVSSTRIEDYPALKNPQSINGVSPQNAEYLRSWVNMRRLNAIGLYTIQSELQRLARWFRILNNPDFKNVSMDDIVAAYLKYSDDVANGDLSGATLDIDLRVLKQFWRFINPDKPPVGISKKKTKIHLQSCQIVSVPQVLSMKQAAESAGDLRAAALIMGVLGTGCRISEILDSNIGDVEIGAHYAKIKVTGKTGFRIVPFVTGLPEIQTWINHHPKSNCKDAPLFVTYNTRGFGNHRLSVKRAEALFSKYATLAGIPEGVKNNPHAVRHLSASEDDRHLTHQEMCLKFGWTFDSDMPKRYTHSDLEELTATVIKVAGVIEPEIITADTKTIIQCPRCNHINAAGARYCDQCSLILDSSLTNIYSGVQGDLSDPDVMQVMVDKKKKTHSAAKN